MGRGEREEAGGLDDAALAELPLVLASTIAGAHGDLRESGSAVDVWVRDHDGKRALLGIHPSTFGTFLTLNVHDPEFAYLGPVCALDDRRGRCLEAHPCRHRRLYDLALRTPILGEELEATIAKVRADQPRAYSIGINGQGVASPEEQYTEYLRLDHDTFLLSVHAPDMVARPPLSCLLDQGVCRTHGPLWKGAACLGLFVTSGRPVTLEPHFTERSSNSLDTTLNAFQYADAHGTVPGSLSLTLRTETFGVLAANAPRLRLQHETLYVCAPGMDDTPLVDVAPRRCRLCAWTAPSGVCVSHSGLMHFADELQALRAKHAAAALASRSADQRRRKRWPLSSRQSRS